MTRAADIPTPAPDALASKLLASLRSLANAENLAGMGRYGIVTTRALGVPMPAVRAMARDAKRALRTDRAGRHRVAALLWESGVHEACILAGLIDEPSLVDEAQMESWAADLDSWDTCDTRMNNLFREAEPAWRKAVEWPGRDEEFVKRAGFVLGATLAVHDKAAADGCFVNLLSLAEAEATDERGFVSKAVNWQIRQIGKRSASLNAEAIATCERLLATHPESRAARWVARDALRERRGDAVRARLGLS